jgi:nucleotide-binding universal stress UspA family protein
MPTLSQVSRLSLKNILFPTDFSPASRAALPFARTLAKIYGSTILVAHSIPPEPRLEVVLDRLPAQDDLIWKDSLRKFESYLHTCSFGTSPWKPLLDRGDLVDVIPAMIQEQNIDLVVLGTHGRRGLTKMILGSSAEKIYRSATCPVLTVGPRTHSEAEWKIRRILCPVDASEDPEPVLHYALSLAEENQAEVIILEALPLVPWQYQDSLEERARRALQGLIPESANDWCTPEVVISWHLPADAILQESETRNVDLIVMSVHKARVSSWSAHLPWPVASEVVSLAHCPVLTIRV